MTEAHVRVFEVKDVDMLFSPQEVVMAATATEVGTTAPLGPYVPLEDVVAAINNERRTLRSFIGALDPRSKKAPASKAQAEHAIMVLDMLEGVIRLHER